MRRFGILLVFVWLAMAGIPAALGDESAPSASPPAAAAPSESDKADTVDIAALMTPGPLGEMALGDPKAPVTVVEYVSMTCPHCARVHKTMFRALKERYIDTGKVYFVLREFPLDPLALAAIMLARCAPADKFFPAVSVMFELQDSWAFVDDPGTALLKVLQPMGFTADSVKKCLADQKVLDGVNWVRDRGEKLFGIKGTPTFFFNGEKQMGELTIEDAEKIIDPLLQAAQHGKS
jgi:protein-disulfide isomerase